MKKIIPVLVVLGLVLSGLGAVATTESDEKNYIHETILFSNPSLHDEGNYISVECSQQTSYMMDTGKPVLPVYTQVFTFPRGTTIENIDVVFSEPIETPLEKKVIPAPAPMPLIAGTPVSQTKEDVTVYTEDDIYPEYQWTSSIKAGLHNGVQSVYVIVRCNPIRYNPAEDMLYHSDSVDVTVDYVLPDAPLTYDDEYDLVIIAPEEFAETLQPLVDHKNNFGVATLLKPVEEIYDEYDGRDNQEDIKLFIYYAKETYNITYAMLVGGRQKQTFKWHIPERVTNNDDGWEGGYASDLYYSDVYKIEDNETVFEDWDSNENDVFAEWSNMVGKSDTMDFLPDVYVGRLACRSVKEVQTVVDKIITYESTAADPSWFKRAVIIAGDTFPPGDGGATGYYEGEIETGVTADLLEDIGFETEKLWTSLETLTGIDDVKAAYKPGAGFVHFAGHGNPASWSTHPPDDTEHVWINGLNLRTVMGFRNKEKLPIVMIGGCHNGQFNVTFANFIKGFLEYGFKYFNIPSEDDPFLGPFWKKEWAPTDTCWGQVANDNGGSIGSIGMTSLGYGYINQFTTAGLGGWIEPRFFDAYANQSKDMLGEAHSQAITDYINIIGNVNSDQIDRKTIEAWCLLGDPSLKIGGYSS